MNSDRRALLQALAGVSALAVAGHADAVLAKSAAIITPAQFAALSAALTGYPAGDPTIAAKVMAAFATPARRAALGALARVVAQTPPAQLDAALQAQGLGPIANDLVSVWYSGVAATPTGSRVVLYTEAYVWTAMTFSKPMGVCGGPTGYWSQPPQ